MPIAKGGRCTSSLWYVRTWRWNAVRSQGVKEQEQTSPWYLSFSLISLFYRNVMTRCYYIYYSCGFFPTRFPLRFSFFFIFFLFDAKQSERGYPPSGTLRDKGETAPLIKTLFSPFVLCQTLLIWSCVDQELCRKQATLLLSRFCWRRSSSNEKKNLPSSVQCNSSFSWW